MLVVVAERGPGSSQNILSTPWCYQILFSNMVRTTRRRVNLEECHFCNKTKGTSQCRIKDEGLCPVDLVSENGRLNTRAGGNRAR